MSITLAVGAQVINLHPDLYWSDEMVWAPVEQTAQRTITGSLVVSVTSRQGGRPITLEAVDDSSGWMTRAAVDQLRNWAASAGQRLTLTLRGVPREVMFRHHDGAGLEAAPVVHYSDVVDGDWYRVTLRLMEI